VIPAPAPQQPAEPVDVFVAGTVFLDIVFTGMDAPPTTGHELWTEGMGSSPGGVANLAVACSRLGLSTSLAAAFGGDVYGDFCWSVLDDGERIDLSPSRRYDGWHSPVTVSMCYDDDRAMVTHGHPPPTTADAMIGKPPPARVCFTELGGDISELHGLGQPAWVTQASAAGAMIFADVGWDSTEVWDVAALRRGLEGCHAFVPNAAEAMAYTRTDSPGAALDAMRDWVPLAVVTLGSGGALAADAASGETAWAPAVPVEALDPTGAGDVFLASLILGTLREWPLQHRLRFANLCAALSVRDFGGALASPGWGEVHAWWRQVRGTSRRAADYAFLDEVIPKGPPRRVSRASATIGMRLPLTTTAALNPDRTATPLAGTDHTDTDTDSSAATSTSAEPETTP
jgi:sugar/nucleoside kinase (ribokinase family)